MIKYASILFFAIFFLCSCDENGNLAVPSSSVSDADIVAGLKEALKVGTDTSVSLTSVTDGYFKNAAIKILLPPEAQKVESTLRSLGQDKLVDDAILSLNRAAEDAASSAKPIFVDAITSMSISDGKDILFGDSTAATSYLKTKTYTSLKDIYKPKIQASLDKVNATKYWNNVFSTYNQIPFVTPVNPDLSDYTTTKALDGLFHMVADEEREIRKNPADRVTDLLKKVFGQLDKH